MNVISTKLFLFVVYTCMYLLLINTITTYLKIDVWEENTTPVVIAELSVSYVRL